MTYHRGYDSGQDFEQRAISLARAIHDPSGTQGAVIVDGRERDAVFIADSAIYCYEFTTRRDKQKAESDGKKLAALVAACKSDPQHRFKNVQGRFVTESEPTADQRLAVERAAHSYRADVVCMSITQLQKNLVDTERYLQLRLQAPFGSAAASMRDLVEGPGQKSYVRPTLRALSTSEEVPFTQLIDWISESERVVLRGDFGIGKSAALAALFTELRSRYFKKPVENRFPLHINLRDMRGLRSATEVLRRHAEEIGFPDSTGLISAWRAGSCDLLLDGFDELVPVQWVGGVRDLRSTRKAALEPVRQLIRETPPIAAVVVAGRTQYFSSDDEVVEALGVRGGHTADLLNFSDDQVREYLGDEAGVPSWVPRRPILLQFWMQWRTEEAFKESRGEAWREFLVRISEREGERIASIRSESFLELLAGVATACREGATALSSVSSSELQDVFRSVFRRVPDEDGLQALMRLPGLVPEDGVDDRRRFVDPDLEEAAFGIDVANYVLSSVDHRLHGVGDWPLASDGLIGETAAAELAARNYPGDQVKHAIKLRMNANHYDAVLLELARCADVMDPSATAGSPDVVLSGAFVPYFAPTGEGYAGGVHFTDSIFEEVDLSTLDLDGTVPSFTKCLITRVTGYSSMPGRIAGAFRDCDISQFTPAEQTTDGIMSLSGIPEDERMALTVLKKVYAQRGSGRKLSALSRGLPQHLRGRVASVVERLESMRLLERVSIRSTELVIPVRSETRRVHRLLENASAGVPDF